MSRSSGWGLILYAFEIAYYAFEQFSNNFAYYTQILATLLHPIMLHKSSHDEHLHKFYI